jgi:protein-tyrosine phosphatase
MKHNSYYDLGVAPVLVSPFPRGAIPDIAAEWRNKGITLALNVGRSACLNQYFADQFSNYHHFPLADSKRRVEQNAIAAADFAVTHLRRTTAGRVLVHCRGGRHRAPLVAGLILVGLGYSGADALALLLQVRPGAFGANQFFADYLAAQDAAPQPVAYRDLALREVATAVQQQRKLGVIS